MTDLTQVGVAGILVLLILDRVFTFLRTYRQRAGNGQAGDQTIEFWRTQHRDMLMLVLESSILPILAKQTDILNELKRLSIDMRETQLRDSRKA